MNGADLFVAGLENEGVKQIFGVPGEENLDVVEALRRSTIKLVVPEPRYPAQHPDIPYKLNALRRTSQVRMRRGRHLLQDAGTDRGEDGRFRMKPSSFVNPLTDGIGSQHLVAVVRDYRPMAPRAKGE
jgi:hypothetical protein